ncbi:hypothetical protein HGRIS_001036 [Hohenbuehelia grisea]|uniref:Uncharacterized protein n=1 Tax=Hohenbuehelia grisea TaxID=104357 RepID=A0ABR3JNA4_9AGAR
MGILVERCREEDEIRGGSRAWGSCSSEVAQQENQENTPPSAEIASCTKARSIHDNEAERHRLRGEEFKRKLRNATKKAYRAKSSLEREREKSRLRKHALEQSARRAEV